MQIGDLETALREFKIASRLYAHQQDNTAINRLTYFEAELRLKKGEISKEDFVGSSDQVVKWSYDHGEVPFGVQVELRSIQIGGQLQAMKRDSVLTLIKRCEELLGRIETLSPDYDSIKAKTLAIKAHLVLQLVSGDFQSTAIGIRIQEQLGFPVDLENKKTLVKYVLEGIQYVWDLYKQADTIVKEKNEIEWAIIRSAYLRDYVQHVAQTQLLGLAQKTNSQLPTSEFEKQEKDFLHTILLEFERCINILDSFGMADIVADTLCDVADVYDILGSAQDRIRFAKQALEIALPKGFSETTARAQRILQNQNTFSAVRDSTVESITGESKDKFLSTLDDTGKTHYVSTILEAFKGRIDVEATRSAVKSDVNDMVAAAKQRVRVVQTCTNYSRLDPY